MGEHEIRRGQQGMGALEPDVVAPEMWIECKRGKRTNPRAALEQAKRDTTEGRAPIAICRDDGAEAFVVMALAEWLRMLYAARRQGPWNVPLKGFEDEVSEGN